MRGYAGPVTLVVEVDKARLKEQALKSEAVQAMLDVFAAEIRDAEEIP